MTVRPVCTVEVVDDAERGGDRNRDGFLADPNVNQTCEVALVVMLDDPLLESANQRHLAEQFLLFFYGRRVHRSPFERTCTLRPLMETRSAGASRSI